MPSPWSMFFSGFLKHPVMVGSIMPSSGKLIRKMLEPVDWANTKLFVEYGPGVGTFCRPILERMAPDAMLIAIDTNPDFIRYLDHTISDPRFDAVNGSAADVERIGPEHGHDKADYLLSGLPFSTLPPGVGPAIAAATHRVLRPGGQFHCLEFSRVQVAALQAPYDAWSFGVLPRLGSLVAGDADSYQYLAESIRTFPDQETLATMMRTAGLARVKHRNLSGGIAAIHVGWRL